MVSTSSFNERLSRSSEITTYFSRCQSGLSGSLAIGTIVGLENETIVSTFLATGPGEVWRFYDFSNAACLMSVSTQ